MLNYYNLKENLWRIRKQLFFVLDASRDADMGGRNSDRKFEMIQTAEEVWR